MRTIIAGSRSCEDKVGFLEFINNRVPWLITEVVSGTCRGPDMWGEDWAIQNQVPIKRFPANWPKFGHGAEFQRNIEMVKYGEALVVAWDGYSKGTGHMLDTVRKMGYTHVYYFMF